ncbi:S-layer homology domain-containing protein [Sporosarcina aquimarina]|uniref:S-layer homology domain-containing protein n=1 Tax=Sporosarcina aquimarina TaxID=114975 RepID=UPI00203CB970|nr:S-layer homology domain-containing protein [Sporosarcina aquimarina]MCM3756291.1 S-layer homology domain-containing protein [Sporosarcina aquimarina]
MKRFFTLITMLAITLVLAVQPAAAAVKFPDVSTANRFHDEIQFLVDKKIISGYSNGSFQPKRNVTRGEAAIMIGRSLGLDGTKRNTKFKDVPKTNGASGYIAAATEKGIIGGYPDGTFQPNKSISRGDMAIILSRGFELQLGSKREFKDVGPNMKASEAINHMAGNYITTGYPDGTFQPQGLVTREQFAAFVARGLSSEFKQRTQKKDGYAYDLTKTYVYGQSDGDLQVTYKKVSTKFAEVPFTGFLWEFKHSGTGKITYLAQDESERGLMLVYPISSGVLELAYPIKINSTWQTGYDMDGRKTITGVNKTVKTPYKTFANAVEVTDDGMKYYFVKGIGLVKVITKSGETISELKSIQ